MDSVRIVIVGSTGSGKTTLAKEVARRLNIPRIELDELHWGPNWTEKPDEVFRQLTFDAVRSDSWVADGNYSQVRDIVWAKAQTLVWLDYSFPLVFRRLTARIIHRGLRHEVLWHGNQETLLKHFVTKDSLIVWLFKTYWRRKRDYPKLLAQPEYAHLTVVRLRSPRQTRKWLKNFVAASVTSAKL